MGVGVSEHQAGSISFRILSIFLSRTKPIAEKSISPTPANKNCQQISYVDDPRFSNAVTNNAFTS